MSRLLRPSEYKFKDRELHDGRRAVVSITSTARSIPFARSAAKTSLAGSSAPSCRTRFSRGFSREPGERRHYFTSCKTRSRGCRWTSRTGTSTWSSRKTRTWRSKVRFSLAPWMLSLHPWWVLKLFFIVYSLKRFRLEGSSFGFS
jgi:hypothetical protein